MAAAAAFVMLAAGSVQAAPIPKGGLTLQETEAWLKAGGVDAAADAKDNAVVVKLGDNQLVVVFMGDCKDGRCSSLQYFYGVQFEKGVAPDDATAAILMNKWNATHRWLRSYVDKDRNPIIEMDVPLSPGVDSDGLDASFGLFLGGVDVFRSFLRTDGPHA
jgi:hypothetical protein